MQKAHKEALGLIPSTTSNRSVTLEEQRLLPFGTRSATSVLTPTGPAARRYVHARTRSWSEGEAAEGHSTAPSAAQVSAGGTVVVHVTALSPATRRSVTSPFAKESVASPASAPGPSAAHVTALAAATAPVLAAAPVVRRSSKVAPMSRTASGGVPVRTTRGFATGLGPSQSARRSLQNPALMHTLRSRGSAGSTRDLVVLNRNTSMLSTRSMKLSQSSEGHAVSK